MKKTLCITYDTNVHHTPVNYCKRRLKPVKSFIPILILTTTNKEKRMAPTILFNLTKPISMKKPKSVSITKYIANVIQHSVNRSK